MSYLCGACGMGLIGMSRACGINIVEVGGYGNPRWGWFTGKGAGGFVSFVSKLFAGVNHGNYGLVNEAN